MIGSSGHSQLYWLAARPLQRPQGPHQRGASHCHSQRPRLMMRVCGDDWWGAGLGLVEGAQQLRAQRGRTTVLYLYSCAWV